MPSSPKKKPLVIVTRKLPDAIETRLMELFDTRLNADDTPLTAAQLVEAVKTADVLVPTVTDRIDSRVLSSLLHRMDGVAARRARRQILFIGATNRTDLIDEALLRRVPDMRLDGPPPRHRQNFNLRGLEAIHVAV